MLALDSWTKRQLVQCQFKRVVQQFMRQRDVERLAVWPTDSKTRRQSRAWVHNNAL
jgi:hypothetical protein